MTTTILFIYSLYVNRELHVHSQRKTQKTKSKAAENNVLSRSDKNLTKRPQSSKNKAASSVVANGNSLKFSASINVEALKKINEMLDVPKPRKVKIL